ncbi:MAG: cation:proton antiporter [Planctomycetaceae bacterium]|nr:cation:proton antiporter [Planctomycetaceae bacterium]
MPAAVTQITVILLLALLACTATTIVRMRDLWAAVMLTGIFSFLGACWMLILDAPDVAFTEAAVGAGIATVLMLGTLALTSREAKPPEHFPILPIAVVVMPGAALVFGTFDMPYFGDPFAPAHSHVMPEYMSDTVPDVRQIESHPGEPQDAHSDEHSDSQRNDSQDRGAHHGVGVPNIITAVLASYRGYDTLGETVVIFTAGIGVLLLLRGRRERRDVEEDGE